MCVCVCVCMLVCMYIYYIYFLWRHTQEQLVSKDNKLSRREISTHPRPVKIMCPPLHSPFKVFYKAVLQDFEAPAKTPLTFCFLCHLPHPRQGINHDIIS